MRTAATIILAISASLCTEAQTLAPSGSLIKPSDNNIAYVGRMEMSNPDRPTFTFPGVQIRTAFTGTSLKMLAKPNSGYFMAKIDDGEAFKVSFNNHCDSVVTLATALPDKTHQVAIMYVSEGYERLPEFRGFILDEGKNLDKPAPLPERKIEFIGNSITCGYGIEALEASAPYKEETANHYLTYAAQTARNLNAIHVVVARSGIGVYRNYNGPRTGDAINMNTEYCHTLLYNKNHQWDFTRFVPDLVCINLGTNDTSTDGAIPKLLQQGYEKLYQQVRSHYPKAKILFLSGSMMDGDALLTAKKAMDTTVEKAHKAGDQEVYRFDLSHHTGSLGYGASWHPSYQQHQYMADELTPFIKQLMKW